MNGEVQAIDWGAEIPVNGKRPEWLKDGERIQWRWPSEQDGWHDRNFPEGLDAARVCIENGVEAIRLPADHPHYAKGIDSIETLSPTPPQGIAQEVVERCVALVRSVATGKVRPDEDWFAEARAIVALLEPVDGDLAIAREIAAPWLIYDSPEGIANGDYDKQPALVAILAAIKRGRSLAAGDGR